MKTAKTLLIFFLAVLLLSSCSTDSKKEPEPGKIDTMTTEAAEEATRMIKEPMDKARAAAEKEDARIRKMQDQSSR